MSAFRLDGEQDFSSQEQKLTKLELYDTCRICLKQFDDEDMQIKITPVVRERFKMLTEMSLNQPNNSFFSTVICESCNTKLRSFFAFREESIENQLKLIRLIEKDENLQNNKNKIKTECNFENHQLVEEVFDDFVITTEYLEDEEPAQNLELEQELDVVSEKELKRSGSVKRAMCGLCGNSYYKDQLQRHIDKVHYKIKRYYCDICGYGSFLRCNLQTHMATHIAKEFREQIKCNSCESTFTRIESLRNHIKTEHETPVMLKCFCGKEFNLRHKLTTHIKRTHNNERDHACHHDLCERRFFTPKELKVHIQKTHLPNFKNTAAFFCEICGKKYSSSKGLATHMKYHQERMFCCTFEGCKKSFITKLLLVNHEKTHLGQRDHMCHLCEKSFFSANHLRRHILVSHEKVRINCFVEGCRFSVGRKDYLRNHILTHRELPEDVKNEYLVKIREMKI